MHYAFQLLARFFDQCESEERVECLVNPSGMTTRRIKFIVCLFCFCVTLLAQGPRVLFIGDSITDGDWGLANGQPSANRNETDLNHVFGHGYQSICAYYLQGHWPKRQYQCFNRGISGHTLKDLEARWKEDVLDMHPDVLSVLIGVNDTYRALNNGQVSFDIEGWKALYASLLRQARAANPNLQIILCTPFLKDGGKNKADDTYAMREEWVCMCAQAVRELAGEFGAKCLDYDKMFDGLLRKYPQLPAKYWVWDTVHPTPAGHQKMADMWLKAFRKIHI